MFEVGEYECSFGDIADLLWAGGDVVQDAPAFGEESEATFTEAA